MLIVGAMKRNRIDPLAAPPVKTRKPMPEWLGPVVLTLVGVALGALCPFIEVAPVRAVCVVVSSMVGRMPIQAGPFDGGM